MVFYMRLFQAFLSLTSWIQFLSFNFCVSFITSSLRLFFGRPLVLIPKGFKSVTFLTSFISSILFRRPDHVIASVFISNNILYLELTETK